MSKALSVIIPVYNEEITLADIVDRVHIEMSSIDCEIIMIDDGSADRSREIAAEIVESHSNVRLLINEQNLGKTQTVVKGIKDSLGDVVVIQDADHEYNPQELVYLYETMIKGDYDVVYGNRFGKKNDVIYLKNYIGNRFLSFISNLFTYPRIRVWIPDMEVCYKMIRGNVARDVAKLIESRSNFGFEPEITARLSKYKKNGEHLKFCIIPISYKPRTVGEGKKMHAFKDGISALKEIIRYNI